MQYIVPPYRQTDQDRILQPLSKWARRARAQVHARARMDGRRGAEGRTAQGPWRPSPDHQSASGARGFGCVTGQPVR